jgi:hypothetical protein
LFAYINSNRLRCYLSNVFTLGLYGALYIVVGAKRIGKAVGANYPGPTISLLLTVLSIGLYPGIMLSVLAFQLGKLNFNSIGVKVLFLNIAAAITALSSSGFLLILSVLLWAHAFWLLIEAEGAVSMTATHNPIVERTCAKSRAGRSLSR